VAGIDDRPGSLRPLLDAGAAACERGDWSSAVAIAEAAAALDPQAPAVVDLMARASTGAGTGGRRRLTVMFCDLVGSTEIASALDPEDTRELLHTYYDACADIVRDHDGHVAQFLGDGVLIYFGYPRAHEDDGLRAVLTGLAITDAVSRLRAPIGDAARELNVRIGIHTGLAVISGLGDGTRRRPGEVVGETPNLAARVQTAAPTGSVVVSADTLQLVRERVEVKPLGPHALKGIDRPVELFEVLSVRSDDEGADDAARTLTVGRASERATLERAWLDASEQSSYVVIAGEPGIGKSHLVRYARGLVPEDGRSVVLRCSALHTNTPLYPVVQLLRSPRGAANAGDGHDPLARLTRVAGSVGEPNDENVYLLAQICSVPWPAGCAVPDLPPEQARERTLALLCGWIGALAREGRLLLVVEDLHWADPSTLDLLQRCVAEPATRPILVLVTTRLAPDTVPGEPTAVLSLHPLEAAECRDLIDKLTGGRLNDAMQSMVAERGDGVPLYMRELAKMLDAENASARDGRTPSVPPTLNDLLVARLDSVPSERDVVEALAVLGRASSPELVAGVVGRAPHEVKKQLDVLTRAGILRSSPVSSRYDFHHTLLRDAAYDVQLLAHRRELHRRSAMALEEAYSASHEDRWEELAHHYQRAGDLEPAVTLWMRAALRQASIAAHVEAIQSFELVLRHLPELDGDQDDLELQARSGLAASLLASHGYTAPEVAEAYDKLRGLAIARDAQLEVSSLYGLWAYYHVTGDARKSLETAETLLERAIACKDEGASLAASAVLGYQLQRLGRPIESIGLLREGRRWHSVQPLFPHHPGIGAGANLAVTQWLLGDFAGARESAEAAAEDAEALDGPTAHFTRAYTHAFVAEFFQVAGRPEHAARHAGRVVQVAGEFGFTSWLAAGMLNLKIAEALTGDLDAIPTIEYCLGAWRAAGAASNLTQFGLGLALAYRAAGRTADALTTIDQALQDAADYQDLYVGPELHRVRGELLIELRPDDGAGPAALDQALATAAVSGSQALELSALLAIERHAGDAGGAGSARDEIDRLLARLDPTGSDTEPLLARARAVLEREPSQ
jgi:class 3 adenylate cyclase/tetratricopeptide (TPR) repeat protein/energy-coupling factor transporter ATP-binding protein EcfA2